MDFVIFAGWLTDPVFHWNGFSVTAAGVFALAACIVIGFSLAGFLQSNFVSRLLGRIGLDKKFFAIVRFVLSLFFIVGFIVLGLNFAGLAVPWEQQIPGLNLSLAQILRLIFAVFLVFWLSSVIKGFLRVHRASLCLAISGDLIRAGFKTHKKHRTEATVDTEGAHKGLTSSSKSGLYSTNGSKRVASSDRRKNRASRRSLPAVSRQTPGDFWLDRYRRLSPGIE